MPNEFRFKNLALYFFRLGAVGYGGPTVLLEYMHRNLVLERSWFTQGEYQEGFVFSQLSPGPLATQLAMYLGWLKSGSRGAFLCAFFLILPSFLMVMLLANLYIYFGNLRMIQALFYGIGASVIAIVAKSVVNLSRKTLGKESFLWILGAINFLYTVFAGAQSLWLFVASGVVVLLRERPARLASWIPAYLFTGNHGEASLRTLGEIFLYFIKIGAIVFGSGLVIVPFMQGGVVEGHHWLSQQEFLDSIAIGMITPGPVLIASAFIGYLIGGFSGSVVAISGIFLPVFLMVVFLAPHFHRFSDFPKVKSFVKGVISAAIGAIAGAAVILGRHSIMDYPTAIIAVVSFVLLIRYKKISEPLMILAAGIIGMVVKSVSSLP